MIALFAVSIISCNKKTDEEDVIAVTSSTLAVKSFSLTPDSKVLPRLDSVFFSVDINHGVIYNADSLPKGTKVSRLIPVITFANSMSKVELAFNKDNRTDTVVNYLTNPSDSIDFSKPVRLNVTAENGVDTYQYLIKVNVHEQNPDSLIWTDFASAPYSTRLPSPLDQKSVKRGETIYSLIEESDNSFSLLTIPSITDPQDNEIQPFSPGFIPQLKSFSANDEYLWLLSEEGDLYFSADGNEWMQTGQNWLSVTGVYLNSLLGIKKTAEGQLYHCHYPENPDITDNPVAPSFPLSGTSSLGILPNSWSTQPIALLAGGVTSEGSPVSDIWAFDGSTWTVISNINPPALRDCSLIHYVATKKDSSQLANIVFDAWLIYGGIKEDDSVNQTIYVSIDNGITWDTATYFMQLPSQFPSLYECDIFVVDSRLSTDIADLWETRSMRPVRLNANVEIEGTDISWDCPYIYFVGGKNSQGILSQDIYRAVLSRLTFTPVF